MLDRRPPPPGPRRIAMEVQPRLRIEEITELSTQLKCAVRQGGLDLRYLKEVRYGPKLF